MKKLTALLLALVMVFALAACNDAGSQNSPSNTPANSPANTPANSPEQPSEPAGPDPVTLRIGYMPNYASLWGVLSAIDQGCFAEEGITIKLTEFDNGPNEIAAMEGGSIDLAYIGVGAHRLCVLGSATIFAPSSVHVTDKIVIHPDSGIQTMEDLRGKTIAFNSGSSSETTFKRALAAAGLTEDDVDGYDMAIDNMVPAMVSGTVDAAVCWNPYSNQILQQVAGSFEIEFASGSTNISSWICLPKYAAENHDILVRFTRALFKGMDWGSKEENYDTVAQLCATQIKSNVESQLSQVGDAHWFNIADITAGMNDGTIEGYYASMQEEFIADGRLEAGDKKEVSQFVQLDVITEALK